MRRIILLFTISIFALQSNAANLYVDSAATGSGSGASWTNAFNRLDTALAVAIAGDSILVAQGTYYPTTGTDKTKSFVLVDSVVLLGGYPTGGGLRNWQANKTILNGDIGTTNNITDNSYHVVYAFGVVGCVLNGFYIQNGYAIDVHPHDVGGGILCFNSPLTLCNVIIDHNSSVWRGGGMYNSSSSPTLSNVTISNNHSHNGGGMYNDLGSDAVFNNAIITNNVSMNSGAGIYNNNYSYPILNNVTITNNHTTLGPGGGIYQENQSYLTLNNVTIANNGGPTCGGICNENSYSKLTNVIISNNYGGPGMFNNNGSNSELTNVTIVNHGGVGIRNFASSAKLTNVTIANNSWGGIYNEEFSYSIITNSIFSGNTAPSGYDIYDTSSSFSVVSYSLLQSDTGGSHNIITNSTQFVDASDPDGPDDIWMTADDGLRLLPCSPAINAGRNDSLSANDTLDIKGDVRIQNGIVDMGAYESNYDRIAYVDSNATGSNKGTSWANAFTDLQDACDCPAADTIHVAKGTYYPSGADRNESFTLRDSLVLLGGYPNSGGTRDWKTNPTILSGDIGAANNSTDNSYTVVYFDSTVTQASLMDGFIVEKGNADSTYISSPTSYWDPQGAGGGIFMNGQGNGNQSSPLISNCIIRDNNALHGGGIFMNGRDFGQSNPTLTNCAFYGNTTSLRDGAASFAHGRDTGQSNPKIYQCLFYNNTSAEDGSALFAYSRFGGESKPDIRQSTIFNTSATSAVYGNYAGTDIGIKNTILWGTLASGNSAASSDSSSLIQSNSDPYPMFIDTAMNNFRLSACSPAINAGDNTFIPADIVNDLDDSMRIQGGTVEIGAYEGGELPNKILHTANVTDTANAQVTDANGWTHYCKCDTANMANSKWLLSLKKNGNTIGNIGDPTFSVTHSTSNLYNTGAATDLSTALYVTADTFFVFNRYWQVTPTTQPTSDVAVRFPYHTIDYNDLKASQPAMNNHSEMQFFKIDGAHQPHSLTVPSTAYHGYAHGTTADTSTWVYTNYTAEIDSVHYAEYAVNSFSGGGGGFGNGTNNSPLPVTYLDFSVYKQASSDLVKWTTASETNNSHFNVQRSSNAVDFETLGTVNSKALNSSTTQQLNYSFTDESPQTGHNYYRLEQVDIDGKKSYSKVINIVWTAHGVVSLYPNPTRGAVNIDFSLNKVSTIELKLLDLSGRVVKSILAKGQKGSNKLQADLSELANGIYQLQLFENNEQVFVGKVRKD